MVELEGVYRKQRAYCVDTVAVGRLLEHIAVPPGPAF